MSDATSPFAVTIAVVPLVLSAVAIGISIRALKISSRQAKLAESKAEKEEKAELTRVILETKETGKRLVILDDYIWKQRLFTRRQNILDAMTEMRAYWKRNCETLRLHLGDESRPYKALRGYYDVALQNESNQPPPNGIGEWRGITPDNLLGYQVEQAFYFAVEELERKRG